jgi:hypothetical protein
LSKFGSRISFFHSNSSMINDVVRKAKKGHRPAYWRTSAFPRCNWTVWNAASASGTTPRWI